MNKLQLKDLKVALLNVAIMLGAIMFNMFLFYTLKIGGEAKCFAVGVSVGFSTIGVYYVNYYRDRNYDTPIVLGIALFVPLIAFLGLMFFIGQNAFSTHNKIAVDNACYLLLSNLTFIVLLGHIYEIKRMVKNLKRKKMLKNEKRVFKNE